MMRNIKELPQPQFNSCEQIVSAARKGLKIAQEKNLDYFEIIARDKNGNEINIHAFDQVYRSDWHS